MPVSPWQLHCRPRAWCKQEVAKSSHWPTAKFQGLLRRFCKPTLLCVQLVVDSVMGYVSGTHKRAAVDVEMMCCAQALS